VTCRFGNGNPPETAGTFAWSTATVDTSTPLARAEYVNRSAKVCAITATPMRRFSVWNTITTKLTALETLFRTYTISRNCAETAATLSVPATA
jgi:hypothetical protein